MTARLRGPLAVLFFGLGGKPLDAEGRRLGAHLDRLSAGGRGGVAAGDGDPARGSLHRRAAGEGGVDFDFDRLVGGQYAAEFAGDFGGRFDRAIDGAGAAEEAALEPFGVGGEHTFGQFVEDPHRRCGGVDRRVAEIREDEDEAAAAVAQQLRLDAGAEGTTPKNLMTVSSTGSSQGRWTRRGAVPAGPPVTSTPAP